MLKIEYFVGNAAGHITRNGEESTLFPGLVLDEDTLASLVVTKGIVCVSIDETELYHIDTKGNRTLVFPAQEQHVQEVLQPVVDTTTVETLAQDTKAEE